jgi:hypothetical protein
MLSLSPRYDLFRFSLPKDFLPDSVTEKYAKILSKNQAVIVTPIDYLNESIQGINFPGISDIIIQQQQHSSNGITRTAGRINVEPKHEMIHATPANPLDKIEQSFKVTFRMNQGLYNYFMLYETTFHQLCKPNRMPHQDLFFIELLNEYGEITARIMFYDVLIDGIDGLDFSYNKVERDSGTFEVTFKFANIDFEIK